MYSYVVAFHIIVELIVIKREDIPADVASEQKNLDAYAKEVCLLEQSFVKDPSKTIQDCVNAQISSIGENIQIGKFTRYKVGEVD